MILSIFLNSRFAFRMPRIHLTSPFPPGQPLILAGFGILLAAPRGPPPCFRLSAGTHLSDSPPVLGPWASPRDFKIAALFAPPRKSLCKFSVVLNLQIWGEWIFLMMTLFRESGIKLH